MLKINPDECLGCGTCVMVCPINQEICPEIAWGNSPDTTEVIMLIENGVITLFHPEKCISCMECNKVCPTKSIYHEKGV